MTTTTTATTATEMDNVVLPFLSNPDVALAIASADALTPISEYAKTLAEAAILKQSAEKKSGGIKDLADGRQDMFTVNPLLINIEPGWNCRDFTSPDNIAHVEALAHSIASDGVKEPMTVIWQDNKLVMRNGESRLRAVFYAINHLGVEIPWVPVRTEDRMASDVDQLVNQRLRNSGKPYMPLEDAALFSRLARLGLSPADIAKRFSLSPVRISQLLDLNAGATKPIREMITAGKISAYFASTTIKAEGANAQAALEEAIDYAKERGQDHATPKHAKAAAAKVGSTAKVRFDAKDVKGILKSARIDENEIDETVTLTITKTDWDVLRPMIG